MKELSKELSIEEKAKAYDEALDRAREWSETKNGYYTPKEFCEEIFPELRGSEDEKIRKELIKGFNKLDKSALWYNGITNGQIISWLEKQSKHSIYDVPSREVILAIWDLGNEWKELTNGSISTKYGTQLAYIQKHWTESEYYLKEKQSKQEEPQVYETGDGNIITYSETDGYKVVKPKFHEGDWIVYKNDICQIVKREEDCNKLVTVFGIKKELVNERNLSTARLWTLQDAKDGDVLQLGKVTAIFQKYIGNKNCKCYCSVCNGEFEIPSQDGADNSYGCQDAIPATKEQRDTLIKEMANAGYIFDFEKKELKRIEEGEPAWSEEDGYITEEIEAIIDAYVLEENNPKALKNWLKSLKDRTQPQSKQEWSEEDGKIYQSIINDTVQENQLDEKQIDWLRNIKYRNFALLQKQWKPSEEQIRALHDLNLTGNISYVGQSQVLIELYKDLKKWVQGK